MSFLATLGGTSMSEASSICPRVLQNDFLKKGEQPAAAVTISAVQFGFSGGQSYDQFFAKVKGYVLEAKAAGAQLVVLPELISLDMMNPELEDGPQIEVIATEYAPRYFAEVQALAKEAGLTILGGSTPRKVGKDIVNTAILAQPDGQTLLQDKLFLTPDEKAWGWTPGKTLQVADTKFGKLAILICYDTEIPVLSNILVPERPEIILVPSMTGASTGYHRVYWTALGRAIEHFAYVVHTGTVGRGASVGGEGWENYGRASFITPQAPGFPGILGQGELNQPSVVTQTFNLQQLREGRKADGVVYPAQSQMEFRR
jgi:predicted amidohydrolase